MRVWTILLVAAACGDNIDGNRVPTADPFTLTTQEDLSVTRAISALDLDVGDVLTAVVPIPPEHGEATTSGLSVTYSPAPDYHGPDQFALIISDGTDEVAFTIDVNVSSLEDIPFGGADALATNEDTPRTVTVTQLLANDSDADGDPLEIASVGEPVNGTVSIDIGEVTFTPNANFNGTASFIYDVSDGTSATPTLVTIVVGASNDAPTAVADSKVTQQDTALTFPAADLLVNDTDPENQILSVTNASNASSGSVGLAGGDITYTPAAGFNGTATFDYEITDGSVFVLGVVTVTVNLP